MSQFTRLMILLSVSLVGIGFLIGYTLRTKMDIQNSSLLEGGKQLRIATVDMNIIEEKYQFFIEIHKEIRALADKKDEEIYTLLKNYQTRVELLEERHQDLTHKEIALVNRALREMEHIYNDFKASADNEIFTREQTLLTEARKEVRQYIETYNKKAGFDYILTNNNNIVYLKNAHYDITEDILQALNKAYKQKPLLKKHSFVN